MLRGLDTLMMTRVLIVAPTPHPPFGHLLPEGEGFDDRSPLPPGAGGPKSLQETSSSWVFCGFAQLTLASPNPPVCHPQRGVRVRKGAKDRRKNHGLPSRGHHSHAEARRTRRREKHILHTSAISASPREPSLAESFLIVRTCCGGPSSGLVRRASCRVRG